MPYRRNYRRNYRRRSYRPRPRPRGAIYGAAARQLVKDVSTLKNMINVEFKHTDTDVDFTSATGGTMTLLNQIPQGDGAGSRDGESCRIKSLEYAEHFNQPLPAGGGVQSRSLLRRIIFIDLDPIGTTPDVSDLLNTNVAAPIIALRNLANRHRFLILKDTTYRLDESDHPDVRVHKYRKMDLKVLYSGTTGDISQIRNNALYVCHLTDQTNEDFEPNVLGTYRLRYIDN